MKTLQQKYASSVYARVTDYKKDHKDNAQKTYGAMSMNMPILVRMSGLVQALAFLEMKASDKKGPYQDLLNDLSQVVMAETGYAKTLSEASRETGFQDYAYLTRHTLLALDWFKRFAQSILKVKTTDSGEEDHDG
ncbi:MAG: type III-B CRISPR module-associated protein Cmr5 [Chloroflexota bacterium]|nr:type III-B CRISPR module-associated protein Cmr5 [Chloroflexota bacterium]